MSLLFTFPEQEVLGKSLTQTTDMERGEWEWRCFPDGESYVRIDSDVVNQEVIILCSLNQPDTKLPALMFLASTARELGAKKIMLIAPYLAYMRQDTRFQKGEAIAAPLFAKFLSRHIDCLITLDPHLHRIHALEEVYDAECHVLSATPLMAEWVKQHAPDAVIIGPDSESKQWVEQVAHAAGTTFAVMQKQRLSDREVRVTLSGMEGHQGKPLVLVDDMISTANTLIQTVEQLKAQRYETIHCLATHGIFAGDAYSKLQVTGVQNIVTTNSITHKSNGMDVASLLALRLLALGR